MDGEPKEDCDSLPYGNLSQPSNSVIADTAITAGVLDLKDRYPFEPQFFYGCQTVLQRLFT
ncbi:hypothetical protein J2T15_004005 [Paenibacillus harenae]|uniref:Uncharacterized protein n=1 Tax=Paenibacillus harenae TaxID=306543 RepID=A0ABT9U8M6_PAEHA|nr:hypothetical protein [Paenibacillus harenae]